MLLGDDGALGALAPGTATVLQMATIGRDEGGGARCRCADAHELRFLDAQSGGGTVGAIEGASRSSSVATLRRWRRPARSSKSSAAWTASGMSGRMQATAR
ncbi:MAG: hypothetical protein U0232_28995 [Thermomicrobiales bacterium]